MSQHPSLLGSQKGKRHRSVFKRYEKLKHLMEKDKWDEKTSSVYSLPKIKSVRFKVKKEKAAAPETEAAGATTATPTTAPGVQPQAAQAQPAGAKQPTLEKQTPPPKDKKAKA